MLKVGVLGCGNVSTGHIPAWETVEGVEIVAVCDIRQERLDMHPTKRCYLDFDDMLANEKLDILDICLPSYLHAEYSIKAMDHGINVMCEKPLSLKKEDVAKVYEAARRNHVNFMVAQVLRFWPEYALIKDIQDSGKFGKLLSGYMCRLAGRPRDDHWMSKEELSGLHMFDLHVHDLDFMVYCFGAPTKVQSWRIKRPEQDCMHALYEYPGCFISGESAAYAAPQGFVARYRFQFEKGMVVYEDGKCTISEPGKETYTFEVDNTNGTTPGNLPRTSGYANEIIYFVDCVKKGVFPDKVKEEEVYTVISILEGIQKNLHE